MTVLRNLRRILVAVGGAFLVLLGILGTALPVIPGMVFLGAGLLLWSTEFPWAQRLLSRLRQWVKDRQDRGRNTGRLEFGSGSDVTGEEEGG